jgi:hypothetical protein
MASHNVPPHTMVSKPGAALGGVGFVVETMRRHPRIRRHAGNGRRDLSRARPRVSPRLLNALAKAAAAQ